MREAWTDQQRREDVAQQRLVALRIEAHLAIATIDGAGPPAVKLATVRAILEAALSP